MFLSRIDYEDPQLIIAMNNHNSGTMTEEDIKYMTKSFRNGNSNAIKLKLKEYLKWNWFKWLVIS